MVSPQLSLLNRLLIIVVFYPNADNITMHRDMVTDACVPSIHTITMKATKNMGGGKLQFFLKNASKYSGGK